MSGTKSRPGTGNWQKALGRSLRIIWQNVIAERVSLQHAADD
ncbi:hypothetical protein [Streptomyces sp. NPDC059460]